MTRDPFPGVAGVPQSQHPYVYCHNNPVNLTDPSGEFAFIPLLLVAAAGFTMAPRRHSTLVPGGIGLRRCSGPVWVG